MNNGKKIYTTIEYVDIDTGEMLTKSIMERMYVKLNKKEITYKEELNYINKIIRYECKYSEQLRLF